MNALSRRLPESPVTTHAERFPVHEFATLDDLYAVEAVATWMRDADFTGFEIVNGFLCACYCWRNVACIGELRDPADPILSELTRGVR
jgi:hypothetical protein